MQRMTSVTLEEFDISPTKGFVPDNPLKRLPEYFSPWEEVCDKLVALWKDGTTRSVIEELPLLDHGKLSSLKEYHRAHVVLTALAHSYVWCHGEQGPAKILPKCIALPWYKVAQHLGLQPVLTHGGYTLHNWQQATPNSDLELINTFTGTKSEEGFSLTAIRIELEFGKGGALCLLKGQQAVVDDDVDTLIDLLSSLQDVIHNMTNALKRIHDVVDPQEFFDLLRPYLTGWNETSALKNGLVYEGVSTKPMKYYGGTAAQSSAFQVIDEFLGIHHQTKTGEEHFLTKMRMYMPPKHRAFIKAIEDGPSLKDFVLEKKNDFLTEKYNGCVEAMKTYRSVHFSIVVKYITIPANNDPDKLNKKLSSTGTGGSDLLPFLKKIRNETEEQKIQ